MRAGMLRHRVTIQRYELVVDDYGAPLHRESWKDVATVWASVEAMSGRDFFAARQEQSVSFFVITKSIFDYILARYI